MVRPARTRAGRRSARGGVSGPAWWAGSTECSVSGWGNERNSGKGGRRGMVFDVLFRTSVVIGCLRRSAVALSPCRHPVVAAAAMYSATAFVILRTMSLRFPGETLAGA